MIKTWLYFGCYKQAGHYLFKEGMHGQYYDRAIEKLTRFDGMLAPQDSNVPYMATVSRLEGFGVSALSFWDYSVDKRGGCNSTFFAPSLTISPDDLIKESASRFPEVWSRFPEVKLQSR
jgi:hypothetical protein